MSYALVRLPEGTIIREYPGPLPPTVVVWPNGDASHGAGVGDERAGARLVGVSYGPDAPGEFYEQTGTSFTLDGATLSVIREYAPVVLSDAQLTLCNRIDATAESVRARYITQGSGQALTYWQKWTEARAFLVDHNPTVAAYPLLAASAGDDIPLADTARAVADKAAEWLNINARIEKVRLAGKAAVNNAKSVDVAVEAMSQLVWP